MTDSANERVLSPGDFGRALKDFLQASLALAPQEPPEILQRLREHLGEEDLSGLPVLSRKFNDPDHANVQVALDAMLADGGWSAEVIGLRSPHGPMGSLALSELVVPPGPAAREYGAIPQIGPVEWASRALEPGQSIDCLVNVVLLLRSGDRRLGALIARQDRMMGMGGGEIALEVISPQRDDSAYFMAEMERLMIDRNVYRGRVLVFSRSEQGALEVEVRALPEVPREAIVLPDGVLERVERHALAPVRHRERLLAAGRHLKRGLLLHGPPGTGKTLTAMHLVSRMAGRTVVMLTGEGFGVIEPACVLARQLEPSIVILEDVDLVGHARSFDDRYSPLLFELLNQMDGLAEDADVLFLLTTNRPDVLEPALAARPGRIDQAVELALPDSEGRARLIDLYSAGLDMRVEDLDAVVARLEGASPAHIKELLRKAALIAADDTEGAIVVTDRHLDEALEDLVIGSSEVKDTLFGEAPAEASFPFPGGMEP